MSRFLSVIPVSEAVLVIRNLAVFSGEEVVPISEAGGRILAMDVKSDVDIPGFTRSVVDGYAVISADTTGSSDAIPAILTLAGRVAMGMPSGLTVSSGSCVYVPTGGILPYGADAAVMVENTDIVGDEILVKKPVAHGENVLLFNEDFSQGSVVLSRGRRISAQDTGVLAAAGCIDVPVARKPRFGVISTGNELVAATARPAPGQVRDVNSYVISAFLQAAGCIPVMYGIIRDDREGLTSALSKAVAECDAVLISGGSSKDERDMVAATVGESGVVLVHGIAIAPGKPTIIGRIGTTPVIGLPGHPASAFIILIALVRHLVLGMTGETGEGMRTTGAVLTENIPSSRGREDYIRVVVKDGRATPLFGKSGLLNTLVQSTGVIRIPAESEGLETGSKVEVFLW